VEHVTNAPPRSPYVPPATCCDEALAADGTWRPHVLAALGDLERADLAALSVAALEAADDAGMSFTVDGGTARFVVDPIPRILPAGEWDVLERGVAQRLRALDAFVDDVHGAREVVAEGVVPARVIDGAEHHEPAARALRPPRGVWINVAGLDLVRGPDGGFLVLEDNVRTPSGIAYTMAARALTQMALGLEAVPARDVHHAPALLGEALAAAAPEGADPEDLHIVVLTDGPSSSAYWEHRVLAERLGVPLVTSDDLGLRGDALVLQDAPGRPINVVYRRTDSSSLHAPAHRLLCTALAAEAVGVVNGFGTGVADDKLTHAYVEDLIRFYLREAPLLPSVRTLDLARPEAREEALDRLDELVVKPRSGSGGHGVVIGLHATAAELDTLRAEVREAPETFIAQDVVHLSTHPTVVDGRLEPRHVDLRPFAFLTPGGRTRVLPGGLTRVALPEGSMVVNSSQDGGAKDTWVLA
jgi:uncharacterized circularly permuted ATP-grasp superfamily protein